MQNDVKHWKLLRLTALPLIVLPIYFLTEREFLLTDSRMQLISWIKQPAITWALVAFIICAFWHAKLGMEEIIIDYVASPGAQKLSLLFNKLIFVALGTASLYAVLAISQGTF